MSTAQLALAPRQPSDATLLTPAGLHVDKVIDLDLLSGYVEVLRPVLSELDLLQQDLLRERTASLEAVFCLDFSEIHDLLSLPSTGDLELPGRAPRTSAAAIIHHQIENKGQQFALLPGTVFELGRFLKKTLAEVGGRPPRRSRGARLSLSNIKGLPERLRSVGIDPNESFPALDDLRQLTELLVQRTARFRWLLEQINLNNLRLVHEEPWFPHVRWPANVFDQVYTYLSQQRAGQSTNNEGDAINYALCTGAANLYEMTGKAFYLIARGHTVAAAFATSPWLRDPLATGAAFPPTGLHRDPAYLILRNHWEDLFRQNPEVAATSVTTMIQKCRRTFAEMHSLRRFGRPDPQTGSTILNLDHAPSELVDRLLEMAEQINREYSRHFQSLFISWESLRHTRSPALPASEGAMLFDVEELAGTAESFRKSQEEAETLKVSFGRFARRARSAVDEIAGRRGLPVHFSAQVVDRHGVQVTEIAGAIEGPNSEGERIRETVVRIDDYGDYYSMWWNASVDLHTFFDWCDYVVRSLGAAARLKPSKPKILDHGFALVARSTDGHARPFSFIHEEEEYIFPLDLFARCSLLDSVARTRAVSIRIFTPYADLWHNFNQQIKTGARMGLLSHVCLPEVLGQFIAVSSIWPATIDSIAAGLKDQLARYEPAARTR